MSRTRCLSLPLLAIIVLLLALLPTMVQAQAYTDIHDFDCAVEGCKPLYPSLLAQGRDGNLYGVTNEGGTNNMGTVFRVTPAGVVTTLYSFAGLDGWNPDGGLVLGTDGNFYGTTTRGGANSSGTVFKITPAGSLTKLHDFTASDATPFSGVVLGKNGKFYGTTCSQFGPWTGYSITAGGTFKHLTNSIPPCSFGGLILAADGNLYGTSQVGGDTGHGTVFKMTPAGGVKVVHSFDGPHGAFLYSPLAQGNDGFLYGTTSGGGTPQSGVVFRVTTTGSKFSVLREFDPSQGEDGATPFAGLVAASDGNFYGATSGGANFGLVPGGDVFSITSDGIYSILFAFDDVHGALAEATPMQHTNGRIYGLTGRGGPHVGEQGVIYSVDMGLPSFVSTVTRWGSAGQTVEILGTGLTGATSVKFGSGAASFNVVSDSYMTATVPTEGSAGFLTVTTPAGSMTSNRSFFVVPVISAISPASGPIGSQVTITGSGFSGATQVKFGGVKAPGFTVNSGTTVTASVPPGAKSGKVSVTTPGGSASSHGVFTVTP